MLIEEGVEEERDVYGRDEDCVDRHQLHSGALLSKRKVKLSLSSHATTMLLTTLAANTRKHDRNRRLKRTAYTRQKATSDLTSISLSFLALPSCHSPTSTYSDSYSAHIKYVIKEAEASSARMEGHPRQQPRGTYEQHRNQPLPRHTIEITLLPRFLIAGVQKDKSQAQYPQFYWQPRH